MKLVRFGEYVVNMDRVNYVHIVGDGSRAYLYCSAPFTPSGIESLSPDYVKLEGANVEALLLWLALNAEDYTREPAPAPALPTDSNDTDSNDIPF